MQETDEEQGGIIFQDRTGERARTRGLFPIVFMSNTTALQKIPAVQQLILPPLTSSARPSSLHLVLMPTKPRHIIEYYTNLQVKDLDMDFDVYIQVLC
ncbi:uncharacterized protein [Mytilus edulis]|uniref:uncharacterized protein isoform X4 n=1 Tax=Mytilus edulis TaxID=6550 RepID=UPI0039EF3A36